MKKTYFVAMKEKGKLSSLLFGVLAIAVAGTILVSGPALMKTETTGFFSASLEEENAADETATKAEKYT